MRSRFSYALFALVLFTVTWRLTASPRRETTPSQPPLVETLLIKPVPIRPQLTLSGRVEPWKSALIRAQVNAPVQARLKQLGDEARAGELLVQLDSEQARLQSRQAEAAWNQSRAGQDRLQAELQHTQARVRSEQKVAQAGLASAQAALQKQTHLTRPQELASARADWQAAHSQREQNAREWQRLEMLWKEGAISDQDAERARLALELSRRRETTAQQSLNLAEQGARSEDRLASGATLQTARAGWELAQAAPLQSEALRHQLGESSATSDRLRATWEEANLQLERHQIRSPFAGRVLELLVEQGDAVRNGDAVCRVGQIDRVKVRFEVPESVRPQLALKQIVRVSCASLPGQIFRGEIRHLGYQADSRSHTFPVEVELANPIQRLLPNMLARLDLPVGPAEQRILVPVSSLAFDSGLAFVYVIEAGRVTRREVVVGRLQQGELVVVEDGLRAGDRLALQPFRLNAGESVR